MRLAAGRKATFDYLQTLWDFPQPWIPRHDDDRHEQTIENPNLPQFPAGTEVALLRQMMLFDNQGNIEATPLTESVQIRVYRKITPMDLANPSTVDEAIDRSGQDFYQIRLSRPLLFANRSGGLRATERNEKEFAMFNAFGPDEGEPSQFISLDQYEPVLHSCFICHSHGGVNSLNTRGRLLKPNWLQHDSAPSAGDRTNADWWQYDGDVHLEAASL